MGCHDNEIAQGALLQSVATFEFSSVSLKQFFSVNLCALCVSVVVLAEEG